MRSDWERVIVIWKKSDDGFWRQAEIKLSQHSGYQTLEWDQIQNTFNDDTAGDPLGGPNGQKLLNHAKVTSPGRNTPFTMTVTRASTTRCRSSLITRSVLRIGGISLSEVSSSRSDAAYCVAHVGWSCVTNWNLCHR